MKSIKKDFTLFQDQSIIYLDSASTSQKPQAVIDAIVASYTSSNANPGRGIYDLAERASADYQKARATVAQFIGAQPDETIFVRGGATEGLNLIAHGMQDQLFAGDEILLSQLEHHANLVPWQRVAQKIGAQIKFIPINSDCSLNYNTLDSLISKRVKIVSITQSSNAIGTSVDLARVVKAAKSVGALVAVDASQSAAHQRIDVAKMGCDFLAFSGHKMLGPTGIGVLYIKRSVARNFPPLLLGGGCVLEVDWQSHTLRTSPDKFEAGSPSLAQAVGLAAAIDYLAKNVDFKELRAKEAALCAQLIKGLKKHKRVTILGPIDDLMANGHLVSFVVDGIHAHDVAAFLASRGICVRAGHFCAQPLMRKLGHRAAVRVSFYLYNDENDVQKLLEAIDSL